MTVVFRDIFTE